MTDERSTAFNPIFGAPYGDRTIAVWISTQTGYSLVSEPDRANLFTVTVLMYRDTLAQIAHIDAVVTGLYGGQFTFESFADFMARKAVR